MDFIAVEGKKGHLSNFEASTMDKKKRCYLVVNQFRNHCRFFTPQKMRESKVGGYKFVCHHHLPQKSS